MTEKYLSFLLYDDEHFLMKASPHISALHFSVIAFEWFCQQSFCLSEKLAALGTEVCAITLITALSAPA
jgi:hypothetical protein